MGGNFCCGKKTFFCGILRIVWYFTSFSGIFGELCSILKIDLFIGTSVVKMSTFVVKLVYLL